MERLSMLVEGVLIKSIHKVTNMCLKSLALRGMWGREMPPLTMELK